MSLTLLEYGWQPGRVDGHADVGDGNVVDTDSPASDELLAFAAR